MTPKQLVKAMAELADGRYHTIQWIRTVHSNGEIEIQVQVYIDGYKWTGFHQGASAALIEMTAQIRG